LPSSLIGIFSLLFDCGRSLVLTPKVSENDELSRVDVACFAELFLCRRYALEVTVHRACLLFLEELLRFLVNLRSHLWPELTLFPLHAYSSVLFGQHEGYQESSVYSLLEVVRDFLFIHLVPFVGRPIIVQFRINLLRGARDEGG